MSWSYDGRDIGISFFDACLKAGAPMRLEPGMKVLEVGCEESDWLTRAATAWPDIQFSGIDTRCKKGYRNGIYYTRDDVMRDGYKPESFDAIVSISAIEHIGLGHYGDPIDPDGDSKALANIWTWLKPGGYLYFDVPYDPTKYYLAGETKTECRVYDDAAVMTRLHMSVDCKFLDLFDAYIDLRQPSVLIDKPKAPHPARYWCVGMLWKKAKNPPRI